MPNLKFTIQSDVGISPTLNTDFLIRMRISSQILEIDLALYFGKIGKPHRKNFHF